jgi:hypothetical protein
MTSILERCSANERCLLLIKLDACPPRVTKCPKHFIFRLGELSSSLPTGIVVRTCSASRRGGYLEVKA